MSAISATTREKIKGFLEGFIQGLINEYKSRTPPRIDPKSYLSQASPEGRLKPFHAAIIPPELLRINAFERSFSTRLGSTFEECARLIALEHHAEAHRGYNVGGKISLSALNEIEKQIAVFEHATAAGKSRPSLQQMIKAVLAARRQTDLQDRVFRADLYIYALDGSKLFFEMKSPMPNKGQCLEVTQRILRFHLLHGQARPKVKAYFAMAYNPYGPNRSDYRWAYARNYMPFDQAVLLGREFWEVVGGPNIYEELLEIYQEVGREKGKGIIDALGFDF
ncbi:MAG: TdeIII family type II restriction endonuclease [candidate division KSB1 bacterium]